MVEAFGEYCRDRGFFLVPTPTAELVREFRDYHFDTTCEDCEANPFTDTQLAFLAEYDRQDN